jgi:hypothetical protein
MIEVHALLFVRHRAAGIFRKRGERRLVMLDAGATGEGHGEGEQGGTQWAHEV